jgi:2-C-methyl-D-erythritol 4-phosphate cytidylyltransferase
LSGRSLLARAFDLLWIAGCRPVVVVLQAQRAAEAESALMGRGQMVVAGSNHQETMLSVLPAIEAERVVVHEYARPLATVDLVRGTMDALEAADAAVTATPVMETLKVVEATSVEGTIDRSNLWHMQRPQAFRLAILLEAHRRAARDGVDGLEDVGAVERYGGTIALVPGSPTNMKIVADDDLQLATAIVQSGV